MRIFLEGTVGSGKSTLAKFLSEKLNIKLYEELLSADTNVLLEKFYKDQTRWSFALQVHFLNERFRMIKDVNKIGSGILDRSIYGDNIFAQLLNDGDNMTDEEYRTYRTLLDNMLEHVSPPDLMVYLKCKTTTAVDRINKRNRGEESHVDLAYWEGLNNKYNQWYTEYDASEKMVIEVDDFNVFDVNQRENVLNQIIDKLNGKCDIRCICKKSLGDIFEESEICNIKSDYFDCYWVSYHKKDDSKGYHRFMKNEKDCNKYKNGLPLLFSDYFDIID